MLLYLPLGQESLLKLADTNTVRNPQGLTLWWTWHYLRNHWKSLSLYLIIWMRSLNSSSVSILGTNYVKLLSVVCLELLIIVRLPQTTDLIFPYRFPFPCGFNTFQYDLPKFAFFVCWFGGVFLPFFSFYLLQWPCTSPGASTAAIFTCLDEGKGEFCLVSHLC